MVRLEPFDGVARLPMSKVWANLENLSSFSAIKPDIWTHKTGLCTLAQVGILNLARAA